MANCCSKCKSKDPPPVFSVSRQKDLDIEHEKVRQAAIALNLGKSPVKLEGEFRIGFDPEERESIESVYKYVPSIPENNTPFPMRKEFHIPRRNSR